MGAIQKYLQHTVSELEKTVLEKDRIIVVQAKRIALFEEFVRLHKIRKYAASSEKSPDQHELCDAAEEMLAASEDEVASAESSTSSSTSSRPKHRRW